MHLEKTTILLEKINNLYKSMIRDADNISNIEKDLLKDYVKSFYEQLLDSKASNTGKQKSKKKSKKRILEKVFDMPEGHAAQHASKEPAENAHTPAEPKKNYVPPRIIQLPKEIEEEIASTPSKQNEEVKHEAPPADNEAMTELFEEEENKKDISSRLSNSPIGNLNKAISINEKIFTVNELFGGNMTDMETTLSALNDCKNFDEARSKILENKVVEYNWMAESRIKKAKKFIKLVRRRYL
ncbi:MAG: hypothetical protein KJP00_03400 [Bacteroidia bacterium]|nr:hypothetical protein [Bacteroidia bacterium]